ncbi:MAG: RagB/SusD family nutrient uptake outer membrane protein, partial [Muribaculaceae bacterium]|nr:RagB/SusD family nutrient uptake outer membrane protein [Muribaculaceae bacterium]
LVSLATAYGIRARVNLVMNKWADAATEAQAALSTTDATPMSMAEVSVPTFASMDEHNWMWGIYVDEQDRVVTSGIVNYPSHMGSLNYGYATVGAWRMVNKQLYNSIPDTDVRKGWFLDEDATSKNLSAAQQSFLDESGAPAYTQVKFAPYQNVIYQHTNANDLPLMRVEEMYYILAEAQAMGGSATLGAKTLQDFVQQYRDPSYTCTAATAEAVQTAVWNQRRVEFWGEGISYLDLMRLNKGLDRRGGGWEPEYVYNIPAGDQIMVLCIPQSETNRNPLISPGDNNPSAARPTAVDDI